IVCVHLSLFFFSSRRRHTRFSRDWSSDVCSSDLVTMVCAMFQIILLLKPLGTLLSSSKVKVSKNVLNIALFLFVMSKAQSILLFFIKSNYFFNKNGRSLLRENKC